MQQYGTLVDAEAVRLQLQRLQQHLQHQDCNDSICMGVGMTMAIGMTTGLPAPDALAEEYRTSAMSISHINPVVEPSWMPYNNMVTPVGWKVGKHRGVSFIRGSWKPLMIINYVQQ